MALPLIPILFLLLLDWDRVRAHVDAFVELKSRKAPTTILAATQSDPAPVDISQRLPQPPVVMNLDDSGFVETHHPGDALTGMAKPRGGNSNVPGGTAPRPSQSAPRIEGSVPPPTLAALPSAPTPDSHPSTKPGTQPPVDPKNPEEEGPKDGEPPSEPDPDKPPKTEPGPGDGSPPPSNPPPSGPPPSNPPPIDPPGPDTRPDDGFPPLPPNDPPPKDPPPDKGTPPLDPITTDPGALTPPGGGQNPPTTPPAGDVNTVPEPTTLLLMFAGVAGVLLMRSRSRGA